MYFGSLIFRGKFLEVEENFPRSHRVLAEESQATDVFLLHFISLAFVYQPVAFFVTINGNAASKIDAISS